jgi:hypothetical protein
LASELQLVRYEDGHRFFSDQVPAHRSPLRFMVQGKASWDPSSSSEQKSAWTMSPGSVFGIEAVNDWARRKQLPGVWSRGEPQRIRCQAIGVVWVLELPADRFDTVFLPEIGRPALNKLLTLVPTQAHAPAVVASMRATPQFARVPRVNLYKLLEWAPTNNLWPVQLIDLEEQQQLEPDPGPLALYYVIAGMLKLTIDDDSRTIQVGEMDGVDLFVPNEQAAQVSMPVAVGGEAWAVMLTRQALETCMRAVPGFARTLGPRDEGSHA